MDFFEHRDKALASSKRLSLMFILAVIFLSLLLSIFLIIFLPQWMMFDVKEYYESRMVIGRLPALIEHLHFKRIGMVFSATIILLCVASFFRIRSLKRRGGRGVAESLGGKLLSLEGATTSEEKRLLNIVAEMALASGVPTPAVYILEDETINAFAAGHTVNDAVVGVTKGAMTQLNRQQLQGIIAHEFSHILYGDMKLNLEMIGILFGISLFQKVGYQLLRSTRGRRNKNSGPVPLVGLGLLIFGSLGYLIASLIRAAISRQREFLADASAVQFTRDPQGISEALSKAASHTLVKSPNASEVAHMFFLTAVKGFFTEPFASHPSVQERLQRIGHIDMKKLGAEVEVARNLSNLHGQSSSEHSGESGISGFVAAGSDAKQAAHEFKQVAPLPTGVRLDKAIKSMGSLDTKNLSKASSFMASLPELVREALHNPERSAELILSLAIANGEDQRKIQREILLKHLNAETIERVFLYADQGAATKPRLAFLHLALPVVKRLNPAGLKKLVLILNALILSDKKIELFEFFLFKNVEKYVVQNSSLKASRSGSLSKAQASYILVRLMANLDTRNASEAESACLAGLGMLGLNADSKGHPKGLDYQSVEMALYATEKFRSEDKRQILGALAQVAAMDGFISPNELELLRGLSIYVGCPMPTVS